MSNPTIAWRVFTVPKEGHTDDECEDAVAGDTRTGRFAIADGASESYAASAWAKLLVDAYVATGAVDNWLGAPRMSWRQSTAAQAVSWYAEEKFKLGAHATFLGVTVHTEAEPVQWSALAAGDACAFVMSRGAFLNSFPLAHSAEFSATPALVGSRGGTPAWREQRGVLHRGDVLLLATDALAKFLFVRAERGAFAGRDLLVLDSADDFALWVAAMRSSGELKNDDVALGIMTID